MKRNRFAGMELVLKGRPAVYLDQDVAEVFDTPEAVNTVLRLAITSHADRRAEGRRETARRR